MRKIWKKVILSMLVGVLTVGSLSMTTFASKGNHGTSHRAHTNVSQSICDGTSTCNNRGLCDGTAACDNNGVCNGTGANRVNKSHSSGRHRR